MPVSLENLLKIGQLKEHPPDVDEIERLLAAAHVADYTGDDVDQSTAENCFTEAKRLIEDVLKWRAVHRPNLVPTTKR
jgi:hypothetical protein